MTGSKRNEQVSQEAVFLSEHPKYWNANPSTDVFLEDILGTDGGYVLRMVHIVQHQEFPETADECYSVLCGRFCKCVLFKMHFNAELKIWCFLQEKGSQHRLLLRNILDMSLSTAIDSAYKRTAYENSE